MSERERQLLQTKHTRRLLTAIYLARFAPGGWYVLAGDNGWLHGDRRSAVDDALWMSKNLGLPIVGRLA
jgi:hypothetical protein